MWSRGAWERAGGWDESMAQNQDGDLAMRALARGVPLVLAEGGMSLYRDHGGARPSISSTPYAEAKLRSRFRVLDRLAGILAEQGRLEAYRQAIGTLCQAIALDAFRGGFAELGRACRARGMALGGEPAVARTLAGRLLTRALGMERKERIAAVLARAGVATGALRRMQRLPKRAGLTP
jgi:O-antigen biosynthesis protein